MEEGEERKREKNRREDPYTSYTNEIKRSLFNQVTKTLSLINDMTCFVGFDANLLFDL